MSVELPIYERFTTAQLDQLPKGSILCQMKARTLKDIVGEVKAAGIKISFDVLEGGIYETDDMWRILSVEGEVAFDPANPYIEGGNGLELQEQYSKDVKERIPGVDTMIGNLSTHLALALEFFKLSNGKWLYLPGTTVRTTTPVPRGYYFQSYDRYPFVVYSDPGRLYIGDDRDMDGYLHSSNARILALYKPEAVHDWNYVRRL